MTRNQIIFPQLRISFFFLSFNLLALNPSIFMITVIGGISWALGCHVGVLWAGQKPINDHERPLEALFALYLSVCKKIIFYYIAVSRF